MIVITHTEDGININNMLEKIGIDQQRSLMAYATDSAYRYMDKYVPKSNGHFIAKEGIYIPGGMLREVVDIYPEGEGFVIDYMMPYARYQYYGQRADGSHKVLNYTTKTPVMTGPYWDKAMLTAEGEDYFDELQRFVDKRLK